jgi:hypothetical protein
MNFGPEACASFNKLELSLKSAEPFCAGSNAGATPQKIRSNTAIPHWIFFQESLWRAAHIYIVKC